MLSGRFWEIVQFCVPLLFCRHVCLSNLKHAPSRELLLTACKTVFSDLKRELTVFYLSLHVLSLHSMFYHYSSPFPFLSYPPRTLPFAHVCLQSFRTDRGKKTKKGLILSQFTQFLALLNKKNTDTIIWPSKNNISWRVDNKKEVIMKLLSMQKKSNLGKILTCRKQYLHHVMTFAESILKLSENFTKVQ